MKIHSHSQGVLPLTLDDSDLAALLSLSQLTIKRNVSRSPSSLPPHVKVGEKKKIWITQISLAWLTDNNLSEPIKLDLGVLPLVLNAAQLASLLHLSEASIASMRSRDASSLPPGSRLGWVTCDVFKWLVKQMVGLPDSVKIEVKSPVFQLSQVAVRRSMASELSSIGRA
jgi:hypothetical protein